MKYRSSVEGGEFGYTASSLLLGGETVKNSELDVLAAAHQRLKVAVNAGELILPTIEILEPVNSFQRMRRVFNRSLAENDPVVDGEKYSDEFEIKGKYRIGARTVGLSINYSVFEPRVDKHGYVISHYEPYPLAFDIDGNVWMPRMYSSNSHDTMAVIAGQDFPYDRYAPTVTEAITKRINRELEHPQFGSDIR